MKLLQVRDLSAEARLAARLRLAEKRVLQSTLDAVRRWALQLSHMTYCTRCLQRWSCATQGCCVSHWQTVRAALLLLHSAQPTHAQISLMA